MPDKRGLFSPQSIACAGRGGGGWIDAEKRGLIHNEGHIRVKKAICPNKYLTHFYIMFLHFFGIRLKIDISDTDKYCNGQHRVLSKIQKLL